MILLILRNERMRVSDLYEEFNRRTKQNLTRPAISHHLKVLLDANILNAEKERQSIYYYVNRIDLIEEMNVARESINRTFPK